MARGYDAAHVRDEGVRVLPPAYPAAALLIAWGLHAVWPLATLSAWLRWSGAALAAGGLALMAWALLHQMRRGTDPNPWAETKTLVTDGPYAVSRNPVYVGDIVIQAGLGLALGWWWAVVLLPLTWLCLRYLVIAREEAFLTRRFGQAYRDYVQRTRRWL